VRDPPDFIRDLGRYTSQGGMVWVSGCEVCLMLLALAAACAEERARTAPA
jgi:hypothetical protein